MCYECVDLLSVGVQLTLSSIKHSYDINNNEYYFEIIFKFIQDINQNNNKKILRKF